MKQRGKILFVIPKFEQERIGSFFPRPLLSIAYLSENLILHNFNCEVFDMNFGESYLELRKKIDIFSPNLIGITIFSLGHRLVYRLIKKIKSDCPNLKIIVGGPHVSCVKEKVMEQCPYIDFACIQEGEDLIVELCNGNDLSKIKGLIFRDRDRITTTEARPLKKELDELPFPTLSKFKLDKYPDEVIIITSRGCPYSCIYCSASVTMGKEIRTKEYQKVVDEIEYWYKKGRRRFNFLDDNFSFYKNRVYLICDEIEKRGLTGLKLSCTNGLRADKLDLPLLNRMKEIGFYRIGIGVESGNDKVLKLLKKGEKIEIIEKAIKTACELDYEVELYFVVGTPGETYEDIQDSIKVALKYPVCKVDFYSLLPFPGTELYDWVEEHNAWVGDKNDLMNDMDMHILRLKDYKGAFATKELPLKKRKKAYQNLRKTMLKIRFNGSGVFGELMAYIGCIGFFHRAYLQNRFIRAVIKTIVRISSKDTKLLYFNL